MSKSVQLENSSNRQLNIFRIPGRDTDRNTGKFIQKFLLYSLAQDTIFKTN